MRLGNRLGGFVVVAFAVAALVIAGCGSSDTPAPKKTGGKDTKPSTATDTKSGDHSGWWCVEHGIPEEMCSMCSEKAAKECKDKGDWCKEHNRAESQCFICDPSRKEKFAAMYRQKYKKDPPPITE